MLGVDLNADDYLRRLQTELDRIDRAEVIHLSDLIYQAWQDGHFVFVFGNGGSATLATHLCEDLAKGTLRGTDLRDENKRRIKVLSLADNTGWLTAVGNDVGYDQIFVQQLMNYGKPDDVVIAISGSGNSPNVLNAVDWAQRHGLKTFGMTGYDGGKLGKLQQAGIHVRLDDMGMVEAIHACLIHWIVDDLYGRINCEGRYRAGVRG